MKLNPFSRCPCGKLHVLMFAWSKTTCPGCGRVWTLSDLTWKFRDK